MTCSYFRKLLADATPLPWVSSSDGDPYIDATSAEAKAWFGDPGASVVAESSYVANKKLIMAAINALPALLRVVEAAEKFEPGSDHASECHHDDGCLCGKSELRNAIDALGKMQGKDYQ